MSSPNLPTSSSPHLPTSSSLRGADWLFNTAPSDSVFTPEGLSDEHRLMAQTAQEFLQKEVLPAIDQLETKDWELARRLVKRCGDLGLLGTDVPEAYGGIDLDKAAAIVVGEAMGGSASFSTTFGAQTGLAIIPILCFGTEAQKQKYLPGIVAGDLIGAYCLSESGSGSDALGARAKAVKQADGSWVLNGEKMWITNGGFADIFIVFAKVDGEHFSAFIVEKDFPGVSHGKEEHKMGLHGSSTTPVILQDARVPAENLLGEVGSGHKIAFNVLNYGRFKLAAMCNGGAEMVVGEAAAYAVNRRQFGQPIASFGAIRHKLGDMAARVFGVESALYRTTGLIDVAVAHGGQTPDAALAALEEFAIEASILKVAASEMLDYVLDENVQIHGGNGFVHDYPAERHYRDARVNRIFEGTNEINRLLVPGMLIKRALKGGLPLISAAKGLQDELLTPSAPSAGGGGNAAASQIAAMKKAGIMVMGLALQTYGAAIEQEQEVLMIASDILMDTFVAESAVLRAERSTTLSVSTAALQQDAATVLLHDAGLRVDAAARTAIQTMVAGDTQRTMLAALRRVLKVAPVDTIAARRRLADAVTDKKAYPFG
ncbi:MAG: acyl-CoA dehydrogenase family protein [Acidobacteria bacterium]|nr:acyl-CoA dehydrogenase family protein [Acidobacteriota bacterium]